MDWKLELLPIPVTDVDRAKAFYVEKAGFIADHDHTVSDEIRFVQLTPPGSACSIALGLGISDAHPGLDAGKTQNVGRVVQCVALQIRGAASGVRNGRIVRIGRGGPANAKQAQGAECCCDLPGRI